MKVCHSDNCEVVVSGGYDQTVRVWDCRSRSIDAVQIMKVCQDSVMSVQCLDTCVLRVCYSYYCNQLIQKCMPCSGDIVAGSVDGTVRRFDVRHGAVVTDLVHHPVTFVQVSNDNRYILACCMDNCIRMLDKEGGQLLNTYTGHHHSYAKIEATCTPDEAYVIGCSEDGKIFFWDIVGSKVVETIQAHSSVVTSLAIHPSGGMLLSASVDGKVKIWR